jgi:hypothetical protein
MTPGWDWGEPGAALAAVRMVDRQRPYCVHYDPLSSKTSSEMLTPID